MDGSVSVRALILLLGSGQWAAGGPEHAHGNENERPRKLNDASYAFVVFYWGCVLRCLEGDGRCAFETPPRGARAQAIRDTANCLRGTQRWI